MNILHSVTCLGFLIVGFIVGLFAGFAFAVNLADKITFGIAKTLHIKS